MASSLSSPSMTPGIDDVFRKYVKRDRDPEEYLLMADYVLMETKESLYRKTKYLFVSNYYFYITENATPDWRFKYSQVTNVVVAGLTGEIAILLDRKNDIVIDSMDQKMKILELLQTFCSRDLQMIYVTCTSLRQYIRMNTTVKVKVQPIGRNFVDLRQVNNILDRKNNIKGRSKYTIRGLISDNGVVRIYHAENHLTGKVFAMKSIKKSSYTVYPELMAKMVRTVHFLQNTQSAFLCRMEESFVTKSRTYLVFEYLSSCTLETVLTRKGKLKQERLKMVLAEIAAALSFIHDSGHVYNNLRPRHTLFDREGHIKLIDFSQVQDVGTIQPRQESVNFLSPEELNKQSLTCAGDWWQLGILAHQIMFGYNPFLDTSQDKIRENILNKSPEFDQSVYSQQALNLIGALLQKSPSQRLGSQNGFYEVVKHPFFKGMSASDVIQRRLPGLSQSKNYPKATLSALEESDCDQEVRYQELDSQLVRFVSVGSPD